MKLRVPASIWRLALAVSLTLAAALFVLPGCASQPKAGRSTPTTAPAIPTAVVQGPLAGVVSPVAASLAKEITTSYNASNQQAQVTITLGLPVPDAATGQARVMALCYAVEKALWANNASYREVDVTVVGPIRDDYSDIIQSDYGGSTVLRATATSLAWDTLTPESAWSHYDNAWLRSSYVPNWHYEAPGK